MSRGIIESVSASKEAIYERSPQMAQNVNCEKKNESSNNGGCARERTPEKPVQISKHDNEWNKRALEIAARELRLPKSPVPAG